MSLFGKLFGKRVAPNNLQSTALSTASSSPASSTSKSMSSRSDTNPNFGTSSTSGPSNFPLRSEHYSVHGLDLSPDAARILTFDQACKQVHGLRMLSDHNDWIEAARDDDYSVLLCFNKAGGLFEAIISPRTNSQFLGMGMPQPEKVWIELGYRLQENLGEKVRLSNGDARIVAHYGHSGCLNEIHYVVPEAPTDAEADTAAWRELGFFSGGRGCVESAMVVAGECYSDEEAVNRIVRYVKEEWTGSLPQGFWLVKAEADDATGECRYCLGYDHRYESIWQAVMEAMEKAGHLPRCASKSFHLAPNDLFMQTQIETIYIKGLLGQT
jgi:hypothetical protein